MKERTRIGLIFGITGAVLIGGLLYFFKVHAPKQARARAQQEIVMWEARYAEARTCLLGAQPASGSSREALAVRELMPDPWNRTTCTKLIGQLPRGLADDTGIMQVEHAWTTLDRAAAKVATSFATHVDPFGEAPDQRGKESPLPFALEELDQARERLRKAAGLPPSVEQQIPTLPKAEVIKLQHDGKPLARLQSIERPSAGGTVLDGRSAAGRLQIVVVPGAAPRIMPVDQSMRALPDLSWGAERRDNALFVGPIDELGKVIARTPLPAPGLGTLYAVAGRLDDGIVMTDVQAADSLSFAFARASGGQPFAITEEPIAHSWSTMSRALDGRVVVAWSDSAEDALRGAILRDGRPPKVIELGSGPVWSSCLTATHAWIGDKDHQFIRFDDTGGQPHVFPDHELVQCSAKLALLRKFGSAEYQVCDEACRPAKLSNLKLPGASALVGDQVAAVRSRGNVIGLWRENAPTTFYDTGGRLTPVIAHSNGEVLDVVGTIGEEAVIVRIKLR